MLDEIISLLKSVFPAREVFLLMKGKGSLLGKNILARERLIFSEGKVSLLGKRTFPFRRKVPIQGRGIEQPEMTS